MMNYIEEQRLMISQPANKMSLNLLYFKVYSVKQQRNIQTPERKNDSAFCSRPFLTLKGVSMSKNCSLVFAELD